MKKLIILFTILSFCLTSCNNEKGSANTDSARKQFLNECKHVIKNSTAKNYNAALAKQYCDCAADNVLPQLSQSELIELGMGNNPELNKKVQNLVKPCIEAYNKQLN